MECTQGITGNVRFDCSVDANCCDITDNWL